MGNIHVAKSEPGLEFSAEDEETLVMFASQAALVIANARRHRDELRARADLEALIDTSPVGVVVFDARRGALKSFNRETARILEGLRTPGHPVEQLLEVLVIRRADGREVSLQGAHYASGAERRGDDSVRGGRLPCPRRAQGGRPDERHAHSL